MSTTTKREMVDLVAMQTGFRRADIHDIIQTFLSAIASEMRQSQRIEFREFGVFELRLRAARMAQNPKTLQKFRVPPRLVVKFKPGTSMRFDDDVEGMKTLAMRIVANRPVISKVSKVAGRPVPRGEEGGEERGEESVMELKPPVRGGGGPVRIQLRLVGSEATPMRGGVAREALNFGVKLKKPLRGERGRGELEERGRGGGEGGGGGGGGPSARKPKRKRGGKT